MSCSGVPESAARRRKRYRGSCSGKVAFRLLRLSTKPSSAGFCPAETAWVSATVKRKANGQDRLATEALTQACRAGMKAVGSLT